MTVVELLIVVGIIIILTAATLPGFIGFAERRDFINKVDEFTNEVRLVRNKSLAGVVVYSEATANPVYWGLRPDCGNTNYDLGYSVDRGSTFVAERADIPLPANVRFSAEPDQCGVVYFERLTGFPTQPVTIRLLHQQGENILNARDIEINSSGQVVLKEVEL